MLVSKITTGIASLLILSTFPINNTAIAKTKIINVVVKSGAKTQIRRHAGWNDNCSVAKTTVKITRKPKHGVITIESGNVKIKEVVVGDDDQCAQKAYKGKHVFYKSKAGYKGKDKFGYSVSYSNGLGFKVKGSVKVK